MARQMRFGKKTESSDTASSGELVPLGFTNWPQFEINDDSLEQLPKLREVAKRFGGASVGFDNPLNPAHARALRFIAVRARIPDRTC